MKKLCVLLAAVLLVMLSILPCYAEDTMSVDPVEPVDPAPAKPSDELIGEAHVGSDAPDVAPDAAVDHPVVPDSAVSVENDKVAADMAVDSVLTTGSETPEMSEQGFRFEPSNFVSNLYYMAVGMVGIFIVIGIIVLATILLNKVFSEKAKND